MLLSSLQSCMTSNRRSGFVVPLVKSCRANGTLKTLRYFSCRLVWEKQSSRNSTCQRKIVALFSGNAHTNVHASTERIFHMDLYVRHQPTLPASYGTGSRYMKNVQRCLIPILAFPKNSFGPDPNQNNCPEAWVCLKCVYLEWAKLLVASSPHTSHWKIDERSRVSLLFDRASSLLFLYYDFCS